MEEQAMKKYFALFIASATAVLATVSCQKESVAPESSEKTVHFVANAVDTKTAFGTPSGTTYPTLWTSRDSKVKILLNTGGNPKEANVTPSADFKSAAFDASVTDDGSGDYTFFAVSPASAFTGYTENYLDWNVTIAPNQTPTATSVDESAMLLVAKSSTSTEFPESVNLDFTHITAYGKLSFTNLATVSGEKIATVKLTAAEKWVGSCFYYIADKGSNSEGDFKTASTASTELVINTDSDTDIWFACLPVDLGGKTIEIVVKTDLSTYAKTITIPAGKKFEAGKIASITVDMASAVKTVAPSYSLIPATGSNNAYAKNCDVTVSGITWNLTGNSQMIPWRIGGKNLSGVDRAIYSKTPIADNISKIVISHGTNSTTVNSMKVYVCSTAAGVAAATPTDVVASFTPTFKASSDVTVTKTDSASWANCYYRIVYNLTVGSSNKFLQFSGAEFYK